MIYSDLYIDQDTYVYGEIIDSYCAKPGDFTDQGTGIYLIEIKPEEGLCDALASMWYSCGGQHCINGEALYHEYQNKRSLTFTSINKPLTSGADIDSGEFSAGQKVKVSCRFYFEDGSMTEAGMYRWPKLQLRFVDLVTENGGVVARDMPEVEVHEAYDF